MCPHDADDSQTISNETLSKQMLTKNPSKGKTSSLLLLKPGGIQTIQQIINKAKQRCADLRIFECNDKTNGVCAGVSSKIRHTQYITNKYEFNSLLSNN